MEPSRISITIYPRTICLLLCWCFWVATARADSPSEACLAMNEEAGRGGWLIVMIKLDDGEPLPFVLDTGCAITVLDDSLKPKLGEPVSTATAWAFGKPKATSIYAAPKLMAGNKILKMSGTKICTDDCQKIASAGGRPVMGILGIDALTNGCLQLDFQAGKIRIFDALGTNEKDLGRAFDLVDIGDGRFAIKESLAGTKDSGSLIDTGFNGDGWLSPKSFEVWTNQVLPPITGEVRAPKGILAGEIYHDLGLNDLGKLDEGSIQNDQHGDLNGIGLSVLAQNLVTFDFPQRKMYLKRTSDWRLGNKDDEEAARRASQSAAELLVKMKRDSHLPGWNTDDEGGAMAAHFDKRPIDIITIDSKKSGGSDVYHHTFTRPPGGDDHSWKLSKAWRTDKNDQTVEEYPIP